MRHYHKFNGAPMAHSDLLHHWNFPRAGDGAKPRAIITICDGAPMAHLTRYAPAALRLRRRSQPHRSTVITGNRAGISNGPWDELVGYESALISTLSSSLHAVDRTASPRVYHIAGLRTQQRCIYCSKCSGELLNINAGSVWCFYGKGFRA